MAIAPKRNHRYSHIQRLKRRSGTIIGKRIEGYVDLTVDCKMIRDCFRCRNTHDPFSRKTVCSKGSCKTPGECRIAERFCLQQQSRIWDGQKYAAPESDDLRRYFSEVVEAAKSNMSVDQSRR